MVDIVNIILGVISVVVGVIGILCLNKAAEIKKSFNTDDHSQTKTGNKSAASQGDNSPVYNNSYVVNSGLDTYAVIQLAQNATQEEIEKSIGDFIGRLSALENQPKMVIGDGPPEEYYKGEAPDGPTIYFRPLKNDISKD